MSVFIRQRIAVQKGFKAESGWIILSALEAEIKNKVERVGTPLKNWDVNIYRGILTGYNDAFIIDQDTRDKLVASSPKSVEIIRPILRGRDIKKYGYDFADLWLINTHNGIKEKGIKPVDIDSYPAVKKHLEHFYPELEKRVDKGVTPYNLRNCAYLEDFSKQKIVWGEISDKANFALDIHDNYFVNNKCYLLTGNRLEYLVCFLNSTISEYLFSKIGTTTGVGTAQWSKFTIEQLCIPLVNEDQEKEFISLMSDLNVDKLTQALINQRIYTICGLTSEEIAFIESR
jgi:hypothetical protein